MWGETSLWFFLGCCCCFLNFTVVLICIFLVIRDAHHLFVYFLAICMSSLENVCFNLLPIFWLGCLLIYLFLILNCMNCLYILESNPLSVSLFICKYFPPFYRLSLVFIFFVCFFCVYFCCAKVFKLNWALFFCVCVLLIFIALGGG